MFGGVSSASSIIPSDFVAWSPKRNMRPKGLLASFADIAHVILAFIASIRYKIAVRLRPTKIIMVRSILCGKVSLLHD